ncbi:MAG: OmpP1/FadL family transporter [Chakrabartia sp.]
MTYTARLLKPALTSAALAALAAPGVAMATDGYFLNGVGAAAKGAGGVAIAMPQDGLAIATNPASATEVGNRLDVGFEVFVPNRGAKIEGNGAGLNGSYSGNGANPFILPELAVVKQVSDRVALGIAISGNGGMNTHYDVNPFARFGASGPAGVNLMQVSIVPTVAVKIAEGHSIGVSPHFVVQGFEATGIQPFAYYSQDGENFSNRGQDWSAGAGVRIGYLGTLTKGVRIGAFYQSKVWTGRFKKYAGLFAGSGGFDVPAAWGIGASVQASPALTLGADFKRIEYSGVTSVGNTLSPLFLGVPFGAANGPGFGWQDVSVWKVGAAYKASDKLTLRLGYGHSDNPVPGSQTLLNILAPGVVQSHVTAGASLKLSPRFDITAYAMHAPRRTVSGEGSIPELFGAGEADVRLAETSVGLSFGWAM